jgi:hypothetical protein
MSVHAWSEHVVRIELVTDDPDITSETLRFLEQRFADREPEAHAEPGGVRLHSEPDRPVTAADVASALAEAGVRAHAVHERQEWSVADIGPALSLPTASSPDESAR